MAHRSYPWHVEGRILPPQPTKHTDSRTFGYSLEHGDEAWELDTLEPPDLRQIVTEAVAEYFDRGIYEDVKEMQAERREELQELIVEALREAAEEE